MEFDGDVDDHYVIPNPGSNRFDVQFGLGLTAPAGADILIQFTLENMVFGGGATYSSADVTVQAPGTRGTDLSGPAATVTHQSGGTKGQTSVVYTVSRAGAVLSEESFVTLAVKDVAMALDATGGTGTVTMTATRVVSGVTFSSNPQSVAMVKVEPVYERIAVAGSPEAKVATGYAGFGGTAAEPTKTASIGSLELGVKDGDHFVLKGSVIDTAAALANSGRAAANIVQSGTVVLGGRLDFLKDVFLSDAGDNECDQLPSPVTFVMDADDGETKEWKTGDDAISVGAWHVNNNETTTRDICIEVADDTTIPAVTDNYTATISLEPITSAVFPPTTSEVLDLGRIGRDGATVHLPALTTSDLYNQRIVIWNRTDSAVPYEFTFTAEGATAGEAASGMLAPGVTNLSLMHDDVVNLGEGNTRTAATFTARASESDISVSTIQVNRETRGTDTVVYSGQ